MTEKLFIVCQNGTNPYENLALEEQLLSNVPENGIILYLWQNAHTVVIGRNQNPWTECRTELLQQENGKLARRLSGGGAVYHDLGNLNFTFICPENKYNLPKQLSVIQRAVSYAGIQAEFSGRNDLLAMGKKFSGNAFYHSKGKSYHHGTLLVSTDTKRLTRYLTPPKAKLESKGIASVRSRVINLNELSPTLTCQQMKDYMMKAFEEIYAGQTSPFPLTQADTIAVAQEAIKYESHDWLYGKPFPFTCTLEGRLSFGSFQIQLSTDHGIITAVRCFTDAMDTCLPQLLSSRLTGCPFQADAMCQAISEMDPDQELAAFIHNQL